MRWLTNLMRANNLKTRWHTTRDVPWLSEFLEHNRLFRQAVYHMETKKKALDSHKRKIPTLKELMEKLDKKLEDELIHNKKGKK